MNITIGVTILVKEPKKDSLFSNGIRQNVILLREIYEKCSNVGKAYMINTANISKEEYTGTTWEKYADHMISVEEARSMCDIIVVCHGSLPLSEYEVFRSMGKKIVKQILGAELSMFNERILFDLPAGGIYKRNSYTDAVWTSPHFYDRDKYFFETIYNCPVYEAPYIWDPRFIEEHVKVLSKEFKGRYVPSGKKAKRLGTMEPNINMVKTSTMPIIITELMERKYPELLERMSVFGTAEVKSKPDLIDFAKDLDSYKAKKMFFEARYPIVWTLSSHVDIVLCWQHGCELNYLYLDAAWLGWPVVHNSPMMKDLGWYYPDNNATIAIEHLSYLARNFDEVEYPNNKYLRASRIFATKYMIENEENVKNYEKLIDLAMNRKV